MIYNKNGQELESKFHAYLESCKQMEDSKGQFISDGPFAGKHNIVFHIWMSRERKEAPFDFWVMVAPDINTVIFCDVVGWGEVPSGIRLNTKNKDWNRLLEYCKQRMKELQEIGYPFTDFKAYLVYSPTKGFLEGDWEFIKVSKSLPTGGLFLSKNRKKGLRSIESVFGKTEEWVCDKEEHFKDASGEAFTLNAMIRTKAHSKLVHEFAAHMQTVRMKDFIENNTIELDDLPPGSLIETPEE